jgi:RNA polymerase sigma factor (sigma-70 family)
MSPKDAIYHELLALRCQRGEKGAFEELVRTWEKPLFYYVRRLVSDEQSAWDILQETWMKTIRGIRSLRNANSLPVWLYSIARKTAMSHLRDAYARQALLECSEHLEDIGEPDIHFSPEDAEQVHQGLQKIALPFREVLTLHFLEGLSVQEIAEIAGIPPGTVKSRLHYARRALRGVLMARK